MNNNDILAMLPLLLIAGTSVMMFGIAFNEIMRWRRG
jgi:hypothetical protein